MRGVLKYWDPKRIATQNDQRFIPVCGTVERSLDTQYTVTALFVSRATGDSPPLAARLKMRIKNGEARGIISRV